MDSLPMLSPSSRFIKLQFPTPFSSLTLPARPSPPILLRVY